MRLIDVNEALRKVEQIPFILNENKAFHEGCRYMQKKALSILHESKTSEAEPVEHGKWVWKDFHCDGSLILCCSECLDTEGARETANYCHNCGAKMDLEG